MKNEADVRSMTDNNTKRRKTNREGRKQLLQFSLVYDAAFLDIAFIRDVSSPRFATIRFMCSELQELKGNRFEEAPIGRTLKSTFLLIFDHNDDHIQS